MSLRVLVADDSSLFRRAVADALAAIPEVEVVGQAANGKLALQKIRGAAARSRDLGHRDARAGRSGRA